MAIELVTYAAIDSLLGLEGTSIDDYPALNTIRNDVTFAIEEYLGRALEKTERTKTIFVGTLPTQMISLDAIPVVSVSSVTLTQAGTDTVLESSEYETTDYGLRLPYRQIQNCKAVIVYTGGWLTADVPGAVTRAALRQVAYEFQSKEQIGAESVTSEGGTVSRPALGLLKEVKRLLDRYKHPLMEF